MRARTTVALGLALGLFAAGEAAAADYRPPTRPSDARVTAKTQTTISVAWGASSDNVGVTSYRTYLNGAQVGTLESTARSTTYQGLACSRSYTLSVRAADAARNLSQAATITAATAACTGPSDATPPTAPANLRTTDTTTTTITAAWDASSDDVGVTGYRTYVASTQAATTTQTSATFASLSCGTRYTLGVRATDAAGNLSAMSTISAATAACPPGGGGGGGGGGTTTRAYWGGWVTYNDYCTPGRPTWSCDSPWVMSSQTTFEQHAGKSASLITFSGNLTNGAAPFDTTAFNNAWNHGSIPIYAANVAGYTDRQVANGAADAAITAWAKAARAWGHPFFLRFAWEMNGSWFTWGVGNQGNTAAEYVAMWRHVHDLFTAAGATNVTWAWVPNIDPDHTMAPLSSVYPGDAYVDWTGMDGYDAGSQSVASLFDSTYATIAGLAPGKPMMLSETAAPQEATNPTKAQWTADLFAAVGTRYPLLRAVSWFNSFVVGPGGFTSWRIESSPQAQAAFAAAIADPRFLPARAQMPSGSPIAAP
jgi:chitodextrinase